MVSVLGGGWCEGRCKWGGGGRGYRGLMWAPLRWVSNDESTRFKTSRSLLVTVGGRIKRALDRSAPERVDGGPEALAMGQAARISQWVGVRRG